MPRTKIVVSAAALGDRKRPLHVNVSQTTASSQVVAKVLQKLQCRDPPVRYQLWATSTEREQSLRDSDSPAAVVGKWAEQGVEPHFHLRLRASGIVRIQHRLSGDQETFQSLIVTPHMTSCDVIQIALNQICPREHKNISNYHLIEKSPSGERVIGDEECPLLLQTGSTQLIMRRKPHPHSRTEICLPPDLSPRTDLPHSPPHSPISPLSSASSPGHTPSSLSVHRNWLSMHSDLISSISHLTSALQSNGSSGAKSHSTILEQSLVQQNQVVEMLKKTVESLEKENERVRERGGGLERRLHAMKMWKTRARLSEERLKEMMESSGVLGSAQDGLISLSALSNFEKMLMVRDKKIAVLQARLEGEGDREGMDKDSKPTVSLQAKLAGERVRVLELEEELLQCREESAKIQRDLADSQSDISRRESEIQYLRYEVEVVKRLGGQQQEVVMGLRAGLQDRDAQITSLTRALDQSSVERERKKSNHSRKSEVIFDLLLGRDVFAVELTKQSVESELGFSVSRFEMPISSRMSSLIVTAVKENSQAYGHLSAGDEILEVNGLNCRNPITQKRAVEVMERSNGCLRIVAARETSPVQHVGRLKSTPVISDSSKSTLWVTANDTSFSPIAPTSDKPHNDDPVSSPHYHLSLSASPSSPPHYSLPLDSTTRPQPIGQGTLLEPPTSPQLTTELGHDLTDEGQDELDTALNEIDHLKMENQLTTAENFDLQQQLKTKEREREEVGKQLAELEEGLTRERERVEREKERVGGLEEENRDLQSQISEANSSRDTEGQRASKAQEELMKLKVKFEKEKNELMTLITSRESQTQQLEAELKSRLIHGEAKEKQVKELESQRVEEKEEGEKIMQRVTTELQELREKSSREMSLLEIEIERLQSQVTSTRTLLDDRNGQDSGMKTELRQLKQVADESNRQLTEMDNDQRKLREQMGLIKEEAESRTVQCESLTLGVKKVESKLQASRQLASRQQEEIDNLRRERRKYRNERDRAEEERNKLEQTLKCCQSELTSLKEQGEGDMFSELESLVAENTDLQNQLITSQERAEHDGPSEQVVELEEEIDKLRKNLEEMSEKKENAMNELALLQSKTEDLEQKLTASETAVKTADTWRKKSEDLVSSMTFVHEQDTAKIKELEETLSACQKGLEEIRMEATVVQEEMSRELLQLGAECAGLKEKVKMLSENLTNEKESRVDEVKKLKETLKASERSLEHIQTELTARESTNSINQATISQLQSTHELTVQEKTILEENLAQSLNHTHQLQEEVESLQRQVRQLESEHSSLAREQQSLLSTCSELEQSHLHREKEVDSLRDNLTKTEAELTETQEKLENAEKNAAETRRQLVQIENSHLSSKNKLSTAESKVQEVTLSLNRRDEEISRLKTQLTLANSELDQLRISTTLLQSTSSSQGKKIKSLQAEKDNLSSLVEQLKTSQEMLRGLVTSLEDEKTEIQGKLSKEVELLRQELREKIEREKDQLSKIQQLERQRNEAQTTAEELLAAQEALRSSLTSLGTEKEGEVVRLRDRLVSLEKDLITAQQNASQSETNEESLKTELSKLLQESEVMSSKRTEVEEKLEEQEEELEHLRETERRFSELSKKVDKLEENQRERNEKMVATQSELDTVSKELEVVKKENEDLVGRVGEIAGMNLSLAETTAQLERVRGELTSEVKARKDLAEEKEQLLNVLRKLEVEKHTSVVSPEPATVVWEEANREKLLNAISEKEEEATRMKEYVSKLLLAVVEKAPFVLERLQ